MMITNAFRSLMRSVGEPVRVAGYALEKAGASFAGNQPAPKPVVGHPVVIKVDAEGLEYDTYPSLKDEAPEPTSFVAPSVKLEGGVQPGLGSSVWYHATITKGSKSLSIGKESSIQERATVSSDATIGDHVVVGPGATIEAGATLSNRCIIGAGAFIGKNAVVASDVIVGEGSLVKDSQTLESGKLYAGAESASGAQAIRSLDADEVEEILSTASGVAAIAKTHAVEWAKDPLLVDLERAAFLSREDYAETVIADSGDEVPLVHLDPNPIRNKTRRGLLFDK